MANAEIYTALGLMSGTSLDGIDAAIITTDGTSVEKHIAAISVPYEDDFRKRLYMAAETHRADDALVKELTLLHADAVKAILKQANLKPSDVDIIGFHGHTIEHRPKDKVTVQIGDGALLAKETGIDVVCDFRTKDVLAGGQGAPLVPVYHHALMANEQKPVAVVNIGGISNVTYVSEDENELVACDLGAGNAYIDDYCRKYFDLPYDAEGAIAAEAKPDKEKVLELLAHPFFLAPPPKSLDRFDFSEHTQRLIDGMKPEEAVATLTSFTAKGIVLGLKQLPHMPKKVYVSGGGRHNDTLMKIIDINIDAPVINIDELGFDGDAVEAEAFAYLAVRSKLGLPLSHPLTTGVPQALPGGAFYPS